MRGQLLPLVAPAVGVVEGNWVEQFIKVRASLGLRIRLMDLSCQLLTGKACRPSGVSTLTRLVLG